LCAARVPVFFLSFQLSISDDRDNVYLASLRGGLTRLEGRKERERKRKRENGQRTIADGHLAQQDLVAPHVAYHVVHTPA